jgi:hypothetical protein
VQRDLEIPMNCLMSHCFWKPLLPEGVTASCALKNIQITGNASHFYQDYTLTAVCSGIKHISATLHSGTITMNYLAKE